MSDGCHNRRITFIDAHVRNDRRDSNSITQCYHHHIFTHPPTFVDPDAHCIRAWVHNCLWRHVAKCSTKCFSVNISRIFPFDRLGNAKINELQSATNAEENN
jgi:hypothetical protein